MKYELMFYLLTLILAISGILVFSKAGNSRLLNRNRYIKYSKNNVKHIFKFKGDINEYNKLFNIAGLNITIYQYQLIRYTVFAVLIIIMLASNKFNLHKSLNISMVLIILCFFASTPKQEFMGKRTPFKLVLDFLTSEFRNRKNIEITRAMSQLKNLTLIKEKDAPGTLFVLEQLSRFTKRLKPIFKRSIKLYNENKVEEAEQYFSNAVGTKEAERFANLLFKLDSLKPAELKSQLELYQESVNRERETNRLNTNKRRSFGIFAVVTLSVFIIIVNFIVVVYIIDVIDMLELSI